MTPKEEWRAVPGYEGLYEVSSLGRVRSLDRVVYTVRYHAASGPRRILGYYLRARSNPAGYPMVDLQRDSKPTAMAVHAIVALAFLGPRPDGYEVAHGNGDRADARLENLRYATPKENQADRYLHGTAIYGSKVPWSKLTEADVIEIRRSDRRQVDLAAAYGVTISCINSILRGKSWKHVPASPFKETVEYEPGAIR